MPLNCNATQDFFKAKTEACQYFSKAQDRCQDCPFFSLCHNLANTPRDISEIIVMAEEWHTEREEMLANLNPIKEINHMLDINQLALETHKNAVDHGWWDYNPNFPEIIALCHSELSEALEEYGSGHKATEIYYTEDKPEGVPVELADCILRILDYCGRTGIDIEKAIAIKTEHNKTRPYRHGGKVC